MRRALQAITKSGSHQELSGEDDDFASQPLRSHAESATLDDDSDDDAPQKGKGPAREEPVDLLGSIDDAFDIDDDDNISLDGLDDDDETSDDFGENPLEMPPPYQIIPGVSKSQPSAALLYGKKYTPAASKSQPDIRLTYDADSYQNDTSDLQAEAAFDDDEVVSAGRSSARPGKGLRSPVPMKSTTSQPINALLHSYGAQPTNKRNLAFAGPGQAGPSSFGYQQGSAPQSTSSTARDISMAILNRLKQIGRSSPTMCIVCGRRPAYNKNGKVYPTCGLTCGDKLKQAKIQAMADEMAQESREMPNHSRWPPSRPFVSPNRGVPRPVFMVPNQSPSARRVRRSSDPSAPNRRLLIPIAIVPVSDSGLACVICKTRPSRGREITTCSFECAERLCTGGADPRMCDYCHRRPRNKGYRQCGKNCASLAQHACLLCRCRPKYGTYHLCGKMCKEIASKWTPMLLEAYPGHDTYKLVERKFQKAWQGGPLEPCPKIKHIYKILESKSFLRPYDQYKRRVGNEAFRYHGTKRTCKLGNDGNPRLCKSNGCSLCQILKTSFRVSLANPYGAFGPGIYTSTASNKAFYYSKGAGAVIVTKVVLGKVYDVNGFNAVTSCPQGYNSVVFDRNSGARNETIVYTDDAIRPVFLITF